MKTKYIIKNLELDRYYEDYYEATYEKDIKNVRNSLFNTKEEALHEINIFDEVGIFTIEEIYIIN